MKKFAVLAALFVLCGCDNHVAVTEYGTITKVVRIPDGQVVDSVDYSIDPSNSCVTIKWKPEQKKTR